ncbi:hypothetical protein H310_10635 [Aphanomyces invadans]|uniref:Uncharacterized protein n=1 Tax=Aphanomyces invadans TaxID=157072 RepID=A0A024TPP0_9STRA|nr:hypothetical protein H310_10635 [Aphanomyces invadans]ETV95978.1 hypothetical protein H310_10635 [Aphanomyces invadans]|eukprot:XP_008875289.1 hypothetical protein H310_10635 [Aphanomyces invadans]
MGKGSKWSAGEDGQLARSWVCTSEDPVKGADQSTESFWASIRAHWTAACGGDGRTPQALKNRWAILNRSAQKFAGYVAQVKARRESGKTDEDMLDDARVLHLSLEREVFQHEEVWRTLNSCPKWQQVSPTKAAKPSSQPGQEVAQAYDAPSARPVGCKQAKRKASEVSATDIKLQDLVQTQNEKNRLFADYMLLQMLQKSTSPQDEAMLSQMKDDYLAKRSRSAKACEDEEVV